MPTYVPVFIPEERLPEVHQLLASRPVAAPREHARDGAPVEPAGFWLDERNIRQHLLTRPRKLRSFARYLASRPGEEVDSHEVAKALELRYGWRSLAGLLGAFGNYCANRRLAAPWSSSYDDPDGHVRFVLDPAVAAAIAEHL